METPWTRARKLKSEIQEDSIGKMEGGKRQVNSGRLWRWKRDGILHNFLVEARTTEKESYRVEMKEFQDIRKQAMQTPPGLRPAMQVDIKELRLVVIELQVFQEMQLHIIELEARLGDN